MGTRWIQDRLSRSGAELLIEEDSHVRLGALKLLRRFQIRPKGVWPRASRSPANSDEIPRVWSAFTDSSDRTELILYWLSVWRKRDLERSKQLGGGDGALGEVGRALAGLLSDPPTAEAAADVDPKLLIEPLVIARFPDRVPERTLSKETLAKLVGRTYISAEVRAIALKELADRDQVPASVVNVVVNSKASDQWARTVDRILLDRLIGPNFVQSIVTALSESSSAGDEDERRRRTGDVVAMLARRNPLVDDALAAIVDPVERFNENVLRWRLIRLAGDPKERASALAVLRRTDKGYLSFMRSIEDWDTHTRRFVQDRIDMSALAYLLSLPGGDGDLDAARRLRELARDSSSVFRYEAIRLMRPISRDSDLDLFIENAFMFDDPQETLADVLRRATLKRLRALAVGDDERLSLVAIAELSRRDRPLSPHQLRSLLRSPIAAVRMLALQQLTKSFDIAELEALGAQYVRGKGTHYYNIVCAIDDRLAELQSRT
jgi:hypothetical protein